MATARSWRCSPAGRDVTEHVEGQRRYRALVEATSSIVWRMSADGHTNLDTVGGHLNVDALTGADLKVTAANWRDFVHPDDRVRTEKAWAEAHPYGRAGRDGVPTCAT